jgi:integrase
MDDQIVVTDINSIEEQELMLKTQVLEEETVKPKEKVALLQAEKEYCDKLYAALSKRIGQHVDQDNFDSLKVKLSVWMECIDEVHGRPNALIQPSHGYRSYSLLRKNPALWDRYSSYNTLRAYRGDLVYWQAWLSAIGFTFNEPITKKEVLTFMIQHLMDGLEISIDTRLVEQGYKDKLGLHQLATVNRRVTSLSVFLDDAKWPNPCRDKGIRELRQNIQEQIKKMKSSQVESKAITRDILDDMLETCGDKLIDIRDRALLLFAWGTGGRRRSEVCAADMKDLTKTNHGGFIYTIPENKVGQEGGGHQVPAKGRIAKALEEWLIASKIKKGPIFRSISKGGDVRKALSPVDVYRIVRRRLKKAGYDETQFSAHSLRSGFITEAGIQGKAIGDVMALTTHKSVATTMRYYQVGSNKKNSATDLAE